MTQPAPGEWVDRATALRLAAELADLRLAVADVTGLPIGTPTAELITALRTRQEPQ